MKKYLPLAVATALWAVLTASHADAAFGYYSPYTVNSGQVPSTQTDFPMLVSITDARLKTVGNGGYVQDAQGDDIRPYSDSALTTAITGYEKVFYDGANGILEMWVKIGSLADGSVIYLAYGNAALTTDGSSTTTWSNSFGRVYHLKDGSTLSKADSTSAGITLSDASGSPATAATGTIDGGAGFASASSQGLIIDGYQQNAITYSIWAKATSFPAAYNYPMSKVNGGGTAFNLIGVKSNGKMRWAVRATTQLDADGTGTATLSTGTWYYLVLTYDSTAGIVAYVNATQDKTVAANGNCATITQAVVIGYLSILNLQYWNGSLDEARVASVARSANWITTEYNNQSAPSTFATLGTQVAVGGASDFTKFFYLFPR